MFFNQDDQLDNILRPPIYNGQQPLAFQMWRGLSKRPKEAWTKKDESDSRVYDDGRGCFEKWWHDDDSVTRRLLIALILAVYSVVGAEIFYVIEKSGPINYNSRTEDSNKTWCTTDFWSSLFFVNTLYTTIGFGTIAPCTVGGQCFTLVYTIFGIPIMVLTVANIGFLMAKWFGWLWRRLKKFYRRLKPKPKVDEKKSLKQELSAQDESDHKTSVVAAHKIITLDGYEKRKREQRRMLPFPVAILICFGWICISALYFYLFERNYNWTYFDAFYFFIVAVATVGLGDLDPGVNQRQRTVADFALIIIGISLFSMCVNIIQYDMENLSLLIGEWIMQEYASALSEGHSMGMIAAAAAAASEDENRSVHERKAAEMSARKVIRNMIRQKGGLLHYFVSASFEDRLLKEYQKRSHMRLASTQTDRDVQDVETMTTGDGMMSKQTSTRDFTQPEAKKPKSLNTRERDAVLDHVHRMFTGHVKRREELLLGGRLSQSSTDIPSISSK